MQIGGMDQLTGVRGTKHTETRGATATAAKPKTASVLDLGSNSLKIANYTINRYGTYKPYHQESIRLKLFDGMDGGILMDDYVNRTIESLKLFRNIVDFENINYVVSVATSAIRDAKNRLDIVQRIRREAGFDFMILSDHDEAVFSYAGAVRALRTPSVLFFDIGGGSLEVVFARNYEIMRVMSLPLGALRLVRMFSEGNMYEKTDLDKMSRHVGGLIPNRADLGIPDSEELTLVGVGGVLRALARYDQYLRGYSLSKVHNYKIDYDSLTSTYKRIIRLPVEKIANINSIGKGRADIILAGNMVILQLMKRLGFESVTVSAHGLREGTLALSLRYPKKIGALSITYRDVREMVCHNSSDLGESVGNFTHLMHSMNLLTDHEQDLLSYALTEIDNLWSFRDVENVLYSIMDDDSHLSHKDQITSALALIYSKKKNKVDPLLLRFENILESNDKGLIKKISSVVSICDIFHRTSARVDAASDAPGSIALTIFPKTNVFPEMLLNQACRRLEVTFGISLKSSIRYPESNAPSGSSV